MRSGDWQKAAAPPSRSRSAASFSSRGSPYELGRSSGPTSAGAWAARFELANLLEAGCSPAELIRMIRLGREGVRPLTMDGSIGLGDEDSGDRNSEASFGGSLDRSDLEAEVAKQKAIMESLNVAEEKNPPWNARAVDS